MPVNFDAVFCHMAAAVSYVLAGFVLAMDEDEWGLAVGLILIGIFITLLASIQ